MKILTLVTLLAGALLSAQLGQAAPLPSPAGTYECFVSTTDGGMPKVQVQADSDETAKAAAERQIGTRAYRDTASCRQISGGGQQAGATAPVATPLNDSLSTQQKASPVGKACKPEESICHAGIQHICGKKGQWVALNTALYTACK